MNTFEFIQCSKNDVQVRSMFDKMVFDPSLVKITVWTFQDFSTIQILREINFGDSLRAKSAILAHLEALNFDFYAFLHFLKAELSLTNKILSL